MTLDLTAVLVALIGVSGPVIAAVIGSLIVSRMKDKQSAEVIANAVRNSVGIAVESAQGMVTRARPAIRIPNVPESLQAPVQYVLDHAGPELERHGITAERVAEKVVAQIGLAKIADPGVPTDSLFPSPAGVTADTLNREELERVRAGG